jgi:hypothetical protein
LRAALSKQKDDKLLSIAQAGAKVRRQIIMYLYGRVNRETVLKYLDIYGNRFDTFRHLKERVGKIVLSFSQGVNVQFSMMYYDITRMILELADIESIESERDISDGGFTIVFQEVADWIYPSRM